MSSVPKPPKDLRSAGQRLFRAVVGEYDLPPHQLEVLHEACRAKDRIEEARAVLKEAGLTIVDRHGTIRPHPCVAVERDSRIQVARLLRELALDPDPASESRPPTLANRYEYRK